jgi:short-subunit dehydrogenase
LADHPREEEHLVEWAQELGKTYGIKTWTFCVDLTEPDGPERLHDEVSRTMGAIHTLVNMRVSAGTASSKICLLTGAPEHDSAQLHGICETEPSVPASYD